ncbi:MAG: hypothetical protein PHI66_02135 [Candidatus Pacebacteria bacterium]|nr:hypothetical protein [Candidatus Paceibacterota bacterium]
MEILNRIDLKKVKNDKYTKRLFLIWFILSATTTLAFYFQIKTLAHIDIPTHIGAGLVITAFIFATIKVKNGRQALALAFIPFILWELTEIGISGRTGSDFLFRLFHETNSNMLQDLIMDTLGSLVFIKMTGKIF